MDEKALLVFLRTLDPVIAEGIYRLAEFWSDQTHEPLQSSPLFEQTLNLLNKAQ